jgi:hypothetical protein
MPETADVSSHENGCGMTSPSETGSTTPPDLTTPLRIVRGAAIGSVLLMCGLYPPWAWADQIAGVVFILVPLGVFSGAILWKLRKAPYNDGLALAVSLGAVGLLATGLAGVVLFHEPGAPWTTLAWLVVFGLIQVIQIGGALTAHRLLARTTGDSRLFASKPEEPPPADLTPFRRPLRLLRVAAVGTIVFLCAAFPARAWNDGVVYWLVFLLCLPLLVILWRLRSLPRRIGLRLARSTGLILTIGFGAFLALAHGGQGVSRASVCLALVVAAQAIMAGIAFRALHLLPPSDKRTGRGGGAVAYYAFVLLLILGSSGMLAQHYGRPPELAMAWLKSLRNCAVAYAEGHPARGFPSNLDQLGPQGDGCLAPLSPTGERAGYTFTYTPAPPEAGGRIPGYRVQARPANPGWLQQKHFFMDHSGGIHVTEEDRDATAHDPRD